MDVDKPAHTYPTQGQIPRFLHGWLKISNSPRDPAMIGWTILGVMHQKSSAKKVTNPSTFLTLVALTSEFPWDSGLRHPFID
jgi:hypothetical protein